jgi:hypothetical protein
MPRKQNLKNHLASLKSSWVILAQGSVFIATVVTGFIKPLAIFNPVAGVTKVRALSVFVVAILTGLFFYLNSVWWRKKDTKKWAVITLVCLFLCVAGFLAFQNCTDTRTCEYSGDIYVIGTQLTAQAERHAALYPGISCKQLLMDFAGRVEDVWTDASINQSRLLLSFWYLVSFSLASICLLSLLQVIKCLTMSRRR